MGEKRVARVATIDSNIELHLHKTAVTHRDLKIIYKKDSFVSATVKNIVDYGIFLVTNDEYKAEGLLHINKLQDKYIYRIEEYLAIGDKIDNIKIVGINEGNKLEFSTMHLTLNKKENLSSEKINGSMLSEFSKEVLDVKKALMNKVGVISDEAEQRLLKSIEDHGLVNFSMAMGRVLENYKIDLGMLIIEEIETKMGDYL
ncbi:S1 RNA-binding domain-containing protein [Bacillus paramycoides]|uniref:S1 RNA-binding domain-containing protein n=1 Tax=Bacillus paramycoides TaxID=2026194 RepID=UPI00224344E3|nr:S1 RNA-binding domain-containing protein [Bacillus paramycoides]MCW9133588.1 S1 RNA-binding domain-containing protein [Bacillus paramycoides]